jgi:hypothetical protein
VIDATSPLTSPVQTGKPPWVGVYEVTYLPLRQ